MVDYKKITLAGIGLSLILFLALYYITVLSGNNHQPVGVNSTSSSSANSSQNAGLESNLSARNSSIATFGSVIGNPIDVGLTTANSGVVFQNPQIEASIRFTAQYSGDAAALIIKVLSTNNHIFKIGLQEDDGSGVPAGKWLSFGTASSQGEKFLKVTLQEPVHITQGKIYHIVSMLEDSASPGDASIMTYAGKSSFQPYYEVNPDSPWPDPKMDTLSFDGKKWSEESKWPTFIVQYTDGREEGQPYTLYAPWIIQTSVYVGQVFVPSMDYNVGRMGFVVDAKAKSDDSLYFKILDSKNNVLSQGVLGNSSQINTTKKWVDTNLVVPVTLKKGELYRIVLFSPRTDVKKAYEVYGHEFSYDPKIGYGGTVDYLTISDNSGVTWQTWNDADIIFRLFVSEGQK